MVAYEVCFLHENLFFSIMELLCGCLLIYGGKQLPNLDVNTEEVMNMRGLQMSFDFVVLWVDASKGSSTIVSKCGERNVVRPDVARE